MCWTLSYYLFLVAQVWIAKSSISSSNYTWAWYSALYHMGLNQKKLGPNQSCMFHTHCHKPSPPPTFFSSFLKIHGMIQGIIPFLHLFFSSREEKKHTVLTILTFFIDLKHQKSRTKWIHSLSQQHSKSSNTATNKENLVVKTCWHQRCYSNR